jgi:hypothetical protein
LKGCAVAAQAIAERDVAIAEHEAAIKEPDAERTEKVKLEAERDRLQSLYEHAAPSSQGERSPLWREERTATKIRPRKQR